MAINSSFPGNNLTITSFRTRGNGIFEVIGTTPHSLHWYDVAERYVLMYVLRTYGFDIGGVNHPVRMVWRQIVLMMFPAQGEI